MSEARSVFLWRNQVGGALLFNEKTVASQRSGDLACIATSKLSAFSGAVTASVASPARPSASERTSRRWPQELAWAWRVAGADMPRDRSPALYSS
jgi:hypothetical protein